jgi:5'-nucleotidase
MKLFKATISILPTLVALRSVKAYNRVLIGVFITLILLTILSCSIKTSRHQKIDEFRLTILHTNDLHGRLHNIPKYSTIVKMARNEGGNVILLDGGDLYRRGPFQVFSGATEIEILNNMGYDAMVFGNNDFPLSDRELYDLSEHAILQNANFPVLLANVTIGGEYVSGTHPYTIITRDGIRIAVIGVTSMKPHDRGFDIAKRYTFECPVVVTDRLVQETIGISDIRLLLSHAGLTKDSRVRNVSAIISADYHLKFSEPQTIRDMNRLIPVVSAGGEMDNYLGRLDLVFHKTNEEWKLIEFSGFLYDIEHVAPDQNILDIIEKYTTYLLERAS